MPKGPETMPATGKGTILDSPGGRTGTWKVALVQERGPNPPAPWELRPGDLRVFYDVGTQEKEVRVLAVGQKRGNSVWIDGEVVQL